MRKLLFVLIGLMLVTLVGCNSGLSKTPGLIDEDTNIPSLKITSGSNTISVEKGGYQWNNGKGSIIACGASPDQIADIMEGDKVKSESELILDFSENPNKVNVVDWSELKNDSYTFSNEEIIVPKDEGTYIYEVIGDWEEGQVSYTIKVIVSKK